MCAAGCPLHLLLLHHALADQQYDPEGQAIATRRGAHEPLSINDFGRVGSSPEIYLPIPLKKSLIQPNDKWLLQMPSPNTSSQRNAAKLVGTRVATKAFDGHIADALPIAIYPRLFEYLKGRRLYLWLSVFCYLADPPRIRPAAPTRSSPLP